MSALAKGVRGAISAGSFPLRLGAPELAGNMWLGWTGGSAVCNALDLAGLMMSTTRKLLVLDLDETLVHAREAPLPYPEDFRVGPYFVYRRPHLKAFIDAVSQSFDLAVWTASGEVYAAQVIEQIFEPGVLKFIWSSQRCTTARDWTTGHYTTIKNLGKLKRQGYALEAIVAVDDTPSKYAKSYGNLVAVREFVGDRADDELLQLSAYLSRLVQVANIRAVEKREWRKQLARGEAT
jgi:carboxy-terminal domain RNA polymerase II polypeptide A small phosphatase